MTRLTRTFSLCLLLAAAGSALADPPQGNGRARYEGSSPEQERGRRDDARDMRDARDARRADEGERRPSKLSPEERRALRQQINEAGQDLYPPKRPP
jgi:hypothetical protein